MPMQPEELSFEILPIFPLNVVLFPQSQLALHIFEDRYKQLVAESLKTHSPFGINLIIDQNMRSVGCAARIIEVPNRYPDGTMDIIVEGERRYSLVGLIPATTLYHMGKIIWLEDEKEEKDTALLKKTVALYNSFVRTVYPAIVPEILAEQTNLVDSFVIAQKAGLDLMQRHIILSMNSEIRRLQFLVQHFEATLPLLSSKKAVEELAKYDGYLQKSR